MRFYEQQFYFTARNPKKKRSVRKIFDFTRENLAKFQNTEFKIFVYSGARTFGNFEGVYSVQGAEDMLRNYEFQILPQRLSQRIVRDFFPNIKKNRELAKKRQAHSFKLWQALNFPN